MIQREMTDKEKGYKCPKSKDCRQCVFYSTLCIAFSKNGIRKYQEWLSKQGYPVKK